MTDSASIPSLISLDSMGLRELDTLRHILRGESVVDWTRAPFDDREQVDRFLALHLVDWRNPSDRALAHRILKEAVDYLRSTFHYRVADAVAEPYEIQDLFLFASGHHPRYPRRFQKIACIVLKVMHVIHHTESRELLFHTPIASAVLHQLVDERVLACGAQMREAGFPVVDFSGSVKTPHSTITKLLAKRDTVAAQVFDKVRYRIVVKTEADVLPMLEYLTRTLFPFNLVVASQTENTLIDFARAIERHPLRDQLRFSPHAQRDRARRASNPFSGESFRVLNLVVDLPIRIDAYLPKLGGGGRLGRPSVVFSWVEFQICDERTAQENEKGEASHDAYKARQRDKVLRRLAHGLVLPKLGG